MSIFSRIACYMKRERLYILLLIFVLSVNFAVFATSKMKMSEKAKHAAVENRAALADKKIAGDTFAARQAATEKILSENRYLATIFALVSLLVILITCLGSIIDVVLVSRRIKGERLSISTISIPAATWRVTDVIRVAVLFIFFGYILVIIESILMSSCAVFKNENVRMVMNTTILDGMTIAFIIHFSVYQSHARLLSLGISLKNWTRNVMYGLAGYIAAVPVIVTVIGVIAFIIHVFKYNPSPQPVVELLMKEKSAPLVLYTGIFAAMVGPFIEELFFRGFMYNAVKKYTGIFGAMVVTSAIFAALHTNIVGFFPIMVIGMVLAYLYEKTGTLVAPITVHILHNFSMMLLVFLMKQVSSA